jgi:guanine deaminase
MVGGKMVVENRRPLNVDLPSLARKVETARQRLESANAGNKALYERLERLVNTFCPGLTKTPYHIDRFAGGHHVHQEVKGGV